MADQVEEKPESPRAHATAPPSLPPYRPTEILTDQPTSINMPAITTVRDEETEKNGDSLKNDIFRETATAHSVVDVTENLRSVALDPQTKDLPLLKTSSYIPEKETNSQESSEQKTDSLTVLSIQLLPSAPLLAQEPKEETNFIDIPTEAVKENIDPIEETPTQKNSLTVPSIRVIPSATFDSEESKQDSSSVAVKEKIDPMTMKKTQEQNTNNLTVPSIRLQPYASIHSQNSENEMKPVDSEALERSELNPGTSRDRLEQTVVICSGTDNADILVYSEEDLSARDWTDDDELRWRFYSGI